MQIECGGEAARRRTGLEMGYQEEQQKNKNKIVGGQVLMMIGCHKPINSITGAWEPRRAKRHAMKFSISRS